MMHTAKEYAERTMGDLHDVNVAPSDEIEAVIAKHIKAAMYDALYDYAWMKDGVTYVGSGIRTFKEAVAKL